MNHDCARQRQDGRWDWTTKNDREQGAYPLGYCRGWHDWTQEQANRIGMPLAYLQQKQKQEDGPFRSKFHTDGHATKEEAERCFYEFCLDHALEFSYDQAMYPCDVPGCETYSSKGLRYSPMGSVISQVTLCDKHCDREGLVLARPFRDGQEIWHS